MKNNFYDKKRYKTQQDIEKYHKVKYETLKNHTEFEIAYSFLNGPKYKSIMAEKQRTPYYKKSIKIIGFKEQKEAKFEKLCKSFLNSIDPSLFA